MKRPRENLISYRWRSHRATAAASGVALGLFGCSLLALPADAAPKKGKSPGVALYKKAEKRFAKKDYAETLALLEKAEAAGGISKADVLNLRGAVHLRRRDFTKAREEFSGAVSADKSLLAARYNLAEVDLAEGRYKESHRRLEGLVGRAKGKNAKQFFQYKALLADMLSGKEESAVRYLSEHRGNPGKPSAEFCYLSAALAYSHGKPAEARRWAARVPRRAPQPVKQLFAASLEKFGPLLLSEGADDAPSSVNRESASRNPSAVAAAEKRSSRRDRGETDASPARQSASTKLEEANPMADAGSAREDSGGKDSAGKSTADPARTTPAAVAMVQFVPENGGSNSSRTTPSAQPARSVTPTPGVAAAKLRLDPVGEDSAPKFRYSETSATDSDYLLAAASPTPKPTPSAAAGATSPKPATASPTGSAAPQAAKPAATPEAPTEAFNKKYEASFVAFSKREYSTALELLKETDAIQPGQADPANLRGLIYARQRLFEQAEVEFKRAVQLDPSFWAAKFNLADLPFTYKNYGLARTRFEALLTEIDPTALPREVELTQFKIFLTLLLEGKEASARAFMSRFKFEGTTPARLYAQAALDFHDGNFERAVSWMESAKKQFPPQLEALFAESFFRIGWLTSTPGLAQADGTAGAPAASPAQLPTPGFTLAQGPAPELTKPILTTDEKSLAANAESPGLSLAAPTPAPAVSAEPLASPTPNASSAAVAAATPAPTASPTSSPSPVLLAQTTPPDTTPAALRSATEVATPTARRSTDASEVASTEAAEQPWVDRLVRVILPAFVALYLLFTPIFILGAVFMRKRSRKSRQIKVPRAYPSDKLAQESKGEPTS